MYNGDNDLKGIMKELHQTLDRHRITSSSIYKNSRGGNMRISPIQSSADVSDYMMQYILGVFRGSYTMIFNMQSTFDFCASAQAAYISKSLHKNIT